ncbi:hypothetical protein RDV77_01580 [Porphyromonadaceae sp. NP-X]|nr:hypothetical protein [Porphyromonadaceae sp. NP-X]
MKSKQILIFLSIIGFLSCKSNSNLLIYNKVEQKNIIPNIQYEFGKGAGHYDYAPSVIQDKYGIRYAFICENSDPFKIVDHIYLYKGIPTKKGYVWQNGTQILAPSIEGWDKCHVCDPDVREFKTTYKGETYNWIMTYLGVDRWDCNHNQIGLAIAKNIEGPYIKFDKNPLICYQDTTQWGVGQSTTIIKDSATIMLFYHSTSDNGPFCMREIKLNDLDKIELGKEKFVPFLPANSYPAISDKYIFIVSEIKTYFNNEIPTWVGDVCSLCYKPMNNSLFDEKNEWIKIGQVDPAKSGFPRNHNPGILTDTKGHMLNNNELIMYFTPAETGENWLWSYDLYSATFNLKNFFK